MIDLHCHSTASDGTLSPEQLVHAALKIGLQALALTDHDTLDGVPPFLAEGAAAGLACIPGVEVASRTARGDHIHILGLFVDPNHAGLRTLLAGIRTRRAERNRQLLSTLATLGYDLDPAKLAADADTTVMGRPHIAKALVDAGYFTAPQEAFDKLLGRGRPAYVAREVPGPGECIASLHQAGAVTVWAHPMVGNSMTNAKALRTATELKGLGLDAVEAYYPEHSAANTAAILNVSRRLQLLVAGGSDFHGETMPTIELGIGRGSLAVPDALVPPLRARAEALRKQLRR